MLYRPCRQKSLHKLRSSKTLFLTGDVQVAIKTEEPSSTTGPQAVRPGVLQVLQERRRWRESEDVSV